MFCFITKHLFALINVYIHECHIQKITTLFWDLHGRETKSITYDQNEKTKEFM